MKMNDMRAPRTRKILEVDVVTQTEDNMKVAELVRLYSSSGVCVVGMYENAQQRNLGDPTSPKWSIGRSARNGVQVLIQKTLEVGLFHSLEEVR